ncbi:MAG: A/G-specific adenine glycosylase [bacterium]
MKKRRIRCLAMVEALMDWYDSHPRDLPWRKNRNPYWVWVSEIMAQQTRIQAVRPYFLRWMERFPTLEALANASEEDVLKLWQGLGYYARARHLHEAAYLVLEKHDGQIPHSYKQLQTLPGVGDYTAAAITSLAFGEREPALDGNALRVYSRLWQIEEETESARMRANIRERALTVMPAERPGAWNEAVMDLGAEVCLPRTPHCSICPIVRHCKAFGTGNPGRLPLHRAQTEPRLVPVAVGILEQAENQYLMRRRPRQGLLGGLWEFPTVEIEPNQSLKQSLESLFAMLGFSVQIGVEEHRLVAGFSHLTWDMSVHRVYLKAGSDSAKNSLRWVSSPEWEELAMGQPHRQIAAWLTPPPLFPDTDCSYNVNRHESRLHFS